MSMKKLVSVILSGAVLVSSAAFAADCDPKFYVGGELQGNQYNSGAHKNEKNIKKGHQKKFGKGGVGGGAFAGVRINEYVGVEVGASAMKGKKNAAKAASADGLASANYSAHTKSHNVYADVLGYVPVSEEVDLIGSIGVGQLTTKVKENLNAHGEDPNHTVGVDIRAKASQKSSKTGVRVGAGAQYKFNENFGARFMVRHQRGNKLIKSVNSAGLGLFYQF